MVNAEWYANWFNSPYYHLLYNNRNEAEAAFFVTNLCENLQLQPGANIWDIACGKGRHSIALNKKGFNVTGTDFSENNIREALPYTNNMLHFYIHDMRSHFSKNNFDVALNLFTSIGYFNNYNDNYLVFENAAAALKPNGVFVVDFFNSKKVAASLKSNYTEIRGNVCFEIKKTIENNVINKQIKFCEHGKNYFFEEKVSLLGQDNFMDFANKTQLTLSKLYGNYRLEPFNPECSDRLILIFKK